MYYELTDDCELTLAGLSCRYYTAHVPPGAGRGEEGEEGRGRVGDSTAGVGHESTGNEAGDETVSW